MDDRWLLLVLTRDVVDRALAVRDFVDTHYGYHGELFSRLYEDYDYDEDVRLRARLVLIMSHEEPALALQYYLGKVREDAEIDAFKEICREKGGKPEPLPCECYNAYCEEGEECVYKNQPIMYDEDIGMYCCQPAGDR
ncbi:MAG: hypothetical protein GXO43_09850 [Crenarchaeota archaeon]|nr:hypothetical protein [Thermoproteota archaeon]